MFKVGFNTTHPPPYSCQRRHLFYWTAIATRLVNLWCHLHFYLAFIVPLPLSSAVTLLGLQQVLFQKLVRWHCPSTKMAIKTSDLLKIRNAQKSSSEPQSGRKPKTKLKKKSLDCCPLLNLCPCHFRFTRWSFHSNTVKQILLSDYFLYFIIVLTHRFIL